MNKKVFIVSNYGSEYLDMFLNQGWEGTDSIAKANLVQFVGGSDITPAFYGEHQHPKTCCDTRRDVREKITFLAALKMKKPMAGICRGAQFLNVMNGGSMWQHVDGHLGDHRAVYLENNGKKARRIKVTSTHHQMIQLPNNRKKFNVLMIAETCTKREKCNTLKSKTMSIISVRDAKKDIEVVHFPKSRCLSFQPHPEFANQKELARLYFEYIDQLLLEKIQ